jgi:ParB family chromosome partitioning protein
MTKKMALGRGLGALIEDAGMPQSREERVENKVTGSLVNEIDIDTIEANPFQPRNKFDEELLKELADSIAKLGIIQPITVRAFNGGYQLISGERRLRAAKIAGLKRIPAYVRTANDQAMLEMALVENIQRQDLDAIEVALSFQRLIDECSLTHDKVSERVGKKRATITNYLRLLKLPAEVQLGIREGKLSMGHARAIASVEDPFQLIKIFRKVLEQDLSVRKTEELVRYQLELKEVSEVAPDVEIALEEPEEVITLRSKLNKLFGWGAELKKTTNGGGKIVISYRNQGELDEIIKKIDQLQE